MIAPRERAVQAGGSGVSFEEPDAEISPLGRESGGLTRTSASEKYESIRLVEDYISGDLADYPVLHGIHHTSG